MEELAAATAHGGDAAGRLVASAGDPDPVEGRKFGPITAAPNLSARPITGLMPDREEWQ